MSSQNIDPNDCDPYEDLVAQCLEEYWDRIEAGETVIEPSALESAAPANVQERIRRAKKCIGVLAMLPPLSGQASHSSENLSGNPRLARPHGREKAIGRFRILEELGMGGFGIVYRAWDPRTDREVALKIPRLETLASVELEQRFAQEARAAAKLDHPNIVTVLEAGSVGMLPYIATTYHSGITLATWLRENHKPIAAKTAAAFARQLALGMAHAHERKVLHRDIKPSNILLVPPAGQDAATLDLGSVTPKLMDFGLAKLSDSVRDMTQTGAMLGTVRYMSPEQAAGRAQQLGPASDVYGLGAVLYELLAGEPPFTADTDLEVLRKLETQEPEGFSGNRRHVPIELETICLKCLEKDPARRYASAQGLADDLDRFLRSVPIAARPATTGDRLLKWRRRNPQLATFIGIASAALIGFVIFLVWSNEKLSTALAVSSEYVYVSDMRLAQEAWENSMAAEAKTLLAKYIPKRGENDLRRFEWHNLWNSMHDASEVVATQPSPVWSLAASPDQKWFATGDRAGVVRLWPLNSTKPTRSSRELRGHGPGDIDVVAFTPDGRQLASAGDDGTVRLWSVETGQPLKVLAEHTDWVGALAISPDGSLLASGAGDGRVLLWDLAEGKLRAELYTHRGPVRWIVFHPRRPLLVSACETGEVRIWDYLANQPPPEAPDGLSQSPLDPTWRNALFDTDGNQLWAPNKSRIVRWDFSANANWQVIGQEYETDQHILALAMLSRRHWFATAHDYDFNIALRPYHEPFRIERLLRGHTDKVRCLVGLPSGDTLLSGSEDGTVRRWRIGLNDSAVRKVPLSDEADAIAWSPTDRAVLIGLRKGGLAIVPDVDKPVLTWLHSTLDHVNAVAWSFAGDRAYATDAKGRLCCFDVSSGDRIAEFDAGEEIHHLATQPSEPSLAYAKKLDVVLADAATGGERWRFHHPLAITLLGFLNRHELITGCDDGVVRCFDTETGEVKRQTSKQRHAVQWVDVSADNRSLATASWEKTIRVFDAHTFAERYRISQPGRADRVFFVDNDRRLLSVTNDQILVIDPTTGQRVLKLPQFFQDGPARANRAGSVLAAPIGDELMLWRLQDSTQH